MKLSTDRKKYPCYNTSLKDLKGEQWKEIPYTEDYYLISNYGRLKAISRPIETNGFVRYTKDKIMKLNIHKVKNEYKNESRYSLVGSFVFDKQPFHFSIRRLVYEMFIQPVTGESMKDKWVYCKDGDGLNNHVSNLALTTISKLRKKTIETDRCRFPSLNLTLEVKRKAILNANSSRRRKVKQFLPDGKFVKEYRSITIAAKKTGNSIVSISDCASGNRPLTKGFVWRFEDEPYHGEYLQKYLQRIPKPVIQYSIAGEKIQTFQTIKEAKEQTGIHASAIRRCVQRTAWMAGGFVWRYSNDPYKGEYKQKFVRKRIIQYNMDGKIAGVFKTALEAAVSTNSSYNGINQALLNNQKTSYGFIWRYEGESFNRKNR